MAKSRPAPKQTAKEGGKTEGEVAPVKNLKKYFIPAIMVANLLILIGVAVALIPGKEEEDTQAAEAPPVDALQLMAEGDAYLRAGKFPEARLRYEKASKSSVSERGAIEYRLGLCAEFDNLLPKALQYYQQANPQEPSETSSAALLGVARVFFKQGQFDLASHAISRLVVISTLPVIAETKLAPRISYAHALTLAAQATKQLPQELTATQHLFRHHFDRTLEELLELVPLEGNQVALQRPVGEGTRTGMTVLRLGADPFATLLSCHFDSTTCIQLLEELASSTGWKISVTPGAHEILTAKRLILQMEDKTAAELLALLLEPRRLFWSFEGDTLIIDRLENFNRDLVLSSRMRRASARLLDALAEAPNDTLAPEAYLALGNLAAINGRQQRAVTYYQEVIQRYPRHATSQLADFNMAKSHYLGHNYEQAKEHFYRVADRRSSTDVRALAYLYLGRVHLDSNESDKAKRLLSRGLVMAGQPEVQAHAALCLASCYLLGKTDGSSAVAANGILMDNRELLREPAWIDQTVFLSALTRYRVALRPGERKRRAQELVAASVKVDPGSFFGDFGYLMVGDSFAELNVTAEALRVYQLGADRAQGKPILSTLLHRTAQEHRKNNDLETATAVLEDLSNLKGSPLAMTAHVEIAEIMITNGEYPACVAYCRNALTRADADADKKQLLGVLGRAYEELGHYNEASLCFGGFLPAASPNETASWTRNTSSAGKKVIQ